METTDRIRKEIEQDTKACWLLVLCLLAAMTIIEYVCVVLVSLWIVPIDSFIPVKIASVVGCVLLVAYALSRVLVILDSQAESWDRFLASLFVFVTLATLYGVARTLPDLTNFLTNASLPMGLLPENLTVRVMISIGMIVVVLPFSFLIRIWTFNLAMAMREIQVNKKRLSHGHS